MKGNIFYIFLIIIFERIKSGIVIEINKEILESKYSDYDYIQAYKISNSIMSFKANGGSLVGRDLSKAFDGNFNTYWQSSTFQKGGFLNDVQVTFTKTVTFDKILYQAPTLLDIIGKGYPIELKVFIKLRNYDGTLSKEDSDYLLVDDFISERTGNKVLFIFNEKIACDQIKLQWAKMEEITIDREQALASEIIFLFPENKYINETIYDIFPKNNYYKLNINPEYNNIIKIEDLEMSMIDYLDILPHIQYLLNRAKKIITYGELKYDPSREFTTNQAAQINIINQHGDVTNYCQKVLLMRGGGTNRQPTGIYAFSNDIITIFVDSDDNDPLPSIIFSQYAGLYTKWLSLSFELNKGINHLNVTEFNIDNIEVKAKKGGPIYIENPYEPNEQSQNIKLYFDDGILFPLFRINDNENDFKKILSNYIIDYNKNIDTYYNVIELYSERLIITWNATDAYKVYIEEGESPQENLKFWDKTIKKLYIFDGIQFEENQPYYNIKNDYINIHMRYASYLKKAAAYAYIEHIGIVYDVYIYKYVLTSYRQMSKSLIHEIGHMIDVKPREYAERTNVVLEQYGREYLFREQYNYISWKDIHEYISPDNIDNSLRNCNGLNICKGFFINSGPYNYPHYVWWDIESFYPGYWGKLNNLYRYNITLIKGMSKTEGMVYLSNLITGIDLGYYFERFGLAFQDNIPFNTSLTSTNYTKAMEEAINQGKVKTGIYRKLWYADNNQYNFTLNKGAASCYKNNNNYNIEITEIKKTGNIYKIILPEIDCIGHLGFEIIENDIVIGFTTDLYYIDKINYPEGYNPRYKIAAYDRLLDYKESSYKSL